MGPRIAYITGNIWSSKVLNFMSAYATGAPCGRNAVRLNSTNQQQNYFVGFTLCMDCNDLQRT